MKITWCIGCKGENDIACGNTDGFKKACCNAWRGLILVLGLNKKISAKVTSKK